MAPEGAPHMAMATESRADGRTRGAGDGDGIFAGCRARRDRLHCGLPSFVAPAAMPTQIADITHAIQLAVAPVFLLTAIATLINVLSGRLSRIVDRRRVLNGRMASATPVPTAADDVEELGLLERRARLIYHAMFCAVLAALLVCLVVAVAFFGALVAFSIAPSVALLFVLAMLAMIVSLALFLREVFLVVTARTHTWR